MNDLGSRGGVPARLQSVGEDAAVLSSVEGDDAPTTGLSEEQEASGTVEPYLYEHDVSSDSLDHRLENSDR